MNYWLVWKAREVAAGLDNECSWHTTWLYGQWKLFDLQKILKQILISFIHLISLFSWVALINRTLQCDIVLCRCVMLSTECWSLLMQICWRNWIQYVHTVMYCIQYIWSFQAYITLVEIILATGWIMQNKILWSYLLL